MASHSKCDENENRNISVCATAVSNVIWTHSRMYDLRLTSPARVSPHDLLVDKTKSCACEIQSVFSQFFQKQLSNTVPILVALEV